MQATFWRTPRKLGYNKFNPETGSNKFVPIKADFTPFKSFFLQGYFSTNVTAANTVDSPAGKQSTGYINRLDLFQHANARVDMYENLFSLRLKSKLWRTMLFLDLTESYMRTNVADSASKSTSNVDSWLFGANISGSFTCPRNIFNLPISFLVTNKFFWINPTTNTYSTNLGPQYANKGDALQPFNSDKNFFTSPHPYYNLDVQVAFTISKQAKADTPGSQNKVFLHLGYVTGINNSSKDYYNSYFQAQIGLSLDIVGTIKKYAASKNSESAAASGGAGK